jgi:type II secretory pathway component PulK
MVRPALTSLSRGAALLLAMLIAALAAVVAVAVAAEQQRWFADVANRRDQVQAQALALAGVQWARQIMQDDARSGIIDHLGEAWAFPLPRTPLENGSIEGGIEDAQARLNINNLAKDDALGKEERARFLRLFELRGIAPGALSAIAGSLTPVRANDDGQKFGNAPRAQPLPANLWPVRAAEVAALPGVAAQDFPECCRSSLRCRRPPCSTSTRRLRTPCAAFPALRPIRWRRYGRACAQAIRLAVRSAIAEPAA